MQDQSARDAPGSGIEIETLKRTRQENPIIKAVETTAGKGKPSIDIRRLRAGTVVDVLQVSRVFSTNVNLFSVASQIEKDEKLVLPEDVRIHTEGFYIRKNMRGNVWLLLSVSCN